MQEQVHMKTKRIILTIAFSAMSLLTYTIFGQIGSQEQLSADSVQMMTTQDSLQNVVSDKERLEDAKASQEESKAKSKITQQKNRDAMEATRESNKAYRSEKQAQKSRENATKQAKKAANAREKSDNN